MPQRHGQHAKRDAALTDWLQAKKAINPRPSTRWQWCDKICAALSCSDCVLRVASDKSCKQPGARVCASKLQWILNWYSAHSAGRSNRASWIFEYDWQIELTIDLKSKLVKNTNTESASIKMPRTVWDCGRRPCKHLDIVAKIWISKLRDTFCSVSLSPLSLLPLLSRLWSWQRRRVGR